MKIFIIFFLFSNFLFSQQIKVERDFGFWGGVSFKKNIFSELSLTLEQQFRTFNNTSKLDDYLLDTKLEYSINKRFSLGGNIRYIHDVKRFQATENNFRYNFDLTYNKKLKKIKIRYRLRYQQELINPYYFFFFKTGQQKIYRSSLRNKVKLNFNYSHENSIYSSFEIFRRIVIFREPYYNKFRFLIGKKINSFDFSIGLEKELSSNYPYSHFFLKTIYKIEK